MSGQDHLSADLSCHGSSQGHIRPVGKVRLQVVGKDVILRLKEQPKAGCLLQDWRTVVNQDPVLSRNSDLRNSQESGQSEQE